MRLLEGGEGAEHWESTEMKMLLVVVKTRYLQCCKFLIQQESNSYITVRLPVRRDNSQAFHIFFSLHQSIFIVTAMHRGSPNYFGRKVVEQLIYSKLWQKLYKKGNSFCMFTCFFNETY